MSAKKQIAKIWTVTDDSTGMYKVGEVDGGFNSLELNEHIKSYGKDDLILHLSNMIYQVISASRQIDEDSLHNGCAKMDAVENIYKTS